MTDTEGRLCTQRAIESHLEEKNIDKKMQELVLKENKPLVEAFCKAVLHNPDLWNL